MRYLFFTILSVAIVALVISSAKAADNFTANQVQSNFGEFVPVLDEQISGNQFTANQVQSVWGEFIPVLDVEAGAVTAVTPDFGTVLIFEE